ncbi:MAG: Gfo/Idh/MocA family oxidoreductase [Ignavibacteriaceae bacterium]
MQKFKFGIIGCGLMGREFASAAARWCHLLDQSAKPEIIAICDKNKDLFDWYTLNFSSISMTTTDHLELLANDDVDAIYCAVPHSFHKDIYIDIIRAGKHLLGEKPFGIDKTANEAILAEIAKQPDVLVRSSSEFPYYPGAQRVVKAIRDNEFGKIIEVNVGFLHSSDINPDKVINWKRMVNINGEYGCMGDLGLHVFHLPLRMGWMPKRVYAQLSNLMTERPDGKGNSVPCETWDNAILNCDVETEGGQTFPMNCKTYRIAPGEIDTWYIEIKGTHKCISYSTKYPKTLMTMKYKPGDSQEWRREDLGYETIYPCITGGIFEFGFTDAILQMWAAFIEELSTSVLGEFGCATPKETHQSHLIFTAALESNKYKKVVEL